jgi:hypothetical protein
VSLNRKKQATIIMLTALLIPAATASIGSFAKDKEKTLSEDKATFTIEVFNLKDTPINLKVESENIEGLRIYHPEEYTVASSEITATPTQKNNWFYLENDKYVQTTKIPIEVQKLANTSRNIFQFDITLRSTADTRKSNKGGAFQNLQQVRTYTFRANTGETSSGLTEGEFTSQMNDIAENVGKTVNKINPLTSPETNSETPSGTTTKDEGQQLDKTGDQKNANDGEREIREALENPDTGEEQASANKQDERTKSKENPTGSFFTSGSHMTAILIMMIAGVTLYLFRMV